MDMSAVATELQTLYDAQTIFTESRAALLFKPGVYQNLDVPVGYYTQVLGLGKSVFRCRGVHQFFGFFPLCRVRGASVRRVDIAQILRMNIPVASWLTVV